MRTKILVSILIFCLFLIGCGEIGKSPLIEKSFGSIELYINWENTLKIQVIPSNTVTLKIYVKENGQDLVSPLSFLRSDKAITYKMDKIPIGSNRSVIVEALDWLNNIVADGRSDNITIEENKTTKVPKITLTPIKTSLPTKPTSNTVTKPIIPPEPLAPPPPTLAIPSATCGSGENYSTDLSWTSVKGATTYEIYRNNNKIDTTTTTSYNDSTLSATSYNYYVTACNSTDCSSQSNTQKVNKPTCNTTSTPPSPTLNTPSTTCGSGGNYSASLSWSSVSGATSYKVYRDGSYKTEVSLTSSNDINLTDSYYDYSITACNSAGCSSQSSTQRANKPSSCTTPPPPTPPSPPPTLISINTSGSPSNYSAPLSWSSVSGATFYKIYRNGSELTTSYSTSYIDTGLSSSYYDYSITACNSAGCSSQSTTQRATAPIPNYTISTSWTPSNGGSTTASSNGLTITITAYPASGWVFQNWTLNGSVVSSANPYVFTATQNANYIANFTNSTPPPPSEICDIKDNNNNGLIDEGLDCFYSIYRLYSSSDINHFYTNKPSELELNGYNYEKIAFKTFKNAATGLTPLYRLWSSIQKDHFYTANASERDYATHYNYISQGDIGYVSVSQISGTVPLYMVYKGGTDHFYTTDLAEANNAYQNLGFTEPKIYCYVWQ